MPLKKCLQFFAVLLMFVSMLVPVLALIQISQMEQREYTAPTVDIGIALKERAYGEIVEVSQTDLKETIAISGEVISTAFLYQELALKSPHLLRLWVKSGDYLCVGDPVGMYQGEVIYATQSGIISKVTLGSEAYIEFYDLDMLALECFVNQDIMKILSRETLKLSDSKGASYEVVRLEEVPVKNGMYRVLLRPVDAELSIGSILDGATMFTGRVYPNCIAVNNNCIYSDGQSYYVRIVDSDGAFIEEVQVEIGETVGNLTCVSGVKPGQYCDSGYKAVVESGGSYEGT